MKHNKEVKISYWAAHLTTIVSVTLVLVIIGIIALISVSASTETRRLRERLEVSVIMADSVSDLTASSLAKTLSSERYVKSVSMISRQEALRNWKNETGEDLETLFGVNPLSPEVCFSLNAEYAAPDSLKMIGKKLSSIAGVEAVALPDATMVGNMNRNIELFTLFLGVVALVMVVISFVLINNTVHLAVYARRFTIHTMQLVGATDGFIRKPFILNNMLSGLISGLVASGLLGLSLAAAPSGSSDDVASYIGWGAFAIVAASLVAAGMFLCSVSAAVATTRYLRRDYEDLFR